MQAPWTDRDRKRLAGLHPDLVRVVERARLAEPFIVVDGLRTTQRQARLVAIGASRTRTAGT
jgi:peptidoglycan L-alanyl-D-glutamate endopeptidase CwlK